MDKMKFLLLSIMLVGCSSAPNSRQLEIYYDGFWTNHRVAKSTADLKTAHRINLHGSNDVLSASEHAALFSGYKTREYEHIPSDLVIYAIQRDTSGEVIREIIGDRQYLYDMSNNLIKELDDSGKNVLRCALVEHGLAKADMSRDMEFCTGHKN